MENIRKHVKHSQLVWIGLSQVVVANESLNRGSSFLIFIMTGFCGDMTMVVDLSIGNSLAASQQLLNITRTKGKQVRKTLISTQLIEIYILISFIHLLLNFHQRRHCHCRPRSKVSQASSQHRRCYWCHWLPWLVLVVSSFWTFYFSCCLFSAPSCLSEK